MIRREVENHANRHCSLYWFLRKQKIAVFPIWKPIILFDTFLLSVLRKTMVFRDSDFRRITYLIGGTRVCGIQFGYCVFRINLGFYSDWILLKTAKKMRK